MSEAGLDQLADGFGSGWEAIGPSVFVDLLDQLLRQRDNDAGIGLPFGWHGADVAPAATLGKYDGYAVVIAVIQIRLARNLTTGRLGKIPGVNLL